MKISTEQAQIVKYLSKHHPSLGSDYIHKVVNIFFSTIASELKNGKRVEIRNFGIFKLKELGERKIFNPIIGEIQKVSAKKIPNFKCSKKLHQIIE